jgi:hypothetical protein
MFKIWAITPDALNTRGMLACDVGRHPDGCLALIAVLVWDERFQLRYHRNVNSEGEVGRDSMNQRIFSCIIEGELPSSCLSGGTSMGGLAFPLTARHSGWLARSMYSVLVVSLCGPHTLEESAG